MASEEDESEFEFRFREDEEMEFFTELAVHETERWIQVTVTFIVDIFSVRLHINTVKTWKPALVGARETFNRYIKATSDSYKIQA